MSWMLVDWYLDGSLSIAYLCTYSAYLFVINVHVGNVQVPNMLFYSRIPHTDELTHKVAVRV